MDFRTLLLQINDIWRFILILWIQEKSQRDQNDLVVTKDEVQRDTVCTNTQKLHSTVLKQKGLDAFHEKTIRMHYIQCLKDLKPKKSEIDAKHNTLTEPHQLEWHAPLTTAVHTNYGLRHRLAPNKWYPNICINTRNAEKITKGSKWPCDYQRRGAKNHCVHQHWQELHSTFFKCNGSFMIH